MICSYISKDWEEFNLKENTEDYDIEGIRDVLGKFVDNAYSYKLVRNGKNLAIFGWLQTGKDIYYAYLLPSKEIDSNGLFVARAMKKFLNNFIKAMTPSEIYTYSLETESLDRWRKFIGFEKFDKQILNNKEYFTWKYKF